MTARTAAGLPARVTVVGDSLLDVDWSGDVDRVCPDAPAPVLEQRDERLLAGDRPTSLLPVDHDWAVPA